MISHEWEICKTFSPHIQCWNGHEEKFDWSTVSQLMFIIIDIHL